MTHDLIQLALDFEGRRHTPLIVERNLKLDTRSFPAFIMSRTDLPIEVTESIRPDGRPFDRCLMICSVWRAGPGPAESATAVRPGFCPAESLNLADVQ